MNLLDVVAKNSRIDPDEIAFVGVRPVMKVSIQLRGQP
jgi:hypothetical protein